jgi:hypothetical protein
MPPSGIPERMLLPQPDWSKPYNLAAPTVTLPGLGSPSAGTKPTVADTSPVTAFERVIPFDPGALEVRRVEQRWQLWAGRVCLKDFGTAETECRDALSLLHELRVNRYCSIGSPMPVMEYWLADDRPPDLALTRRPVTAFDPAALRPELIDGTWWLRDDRQVLFNFGAQYDAARLADAVCKRKGFNRIGFVGHPRPVMTFLLVDPESIGATAEKAKVKPTGLTFQPQMVPRKALFIRDLGYFGECVPFDGMRAEVRRVGTDWKLAAGDVELADFGIHDQAAREALRALEFYRFNEYCQIGASFRFYLARGRAPEGLAIGMRGKPFHRESLQVQLVGKKWVIREGDRVVFDVGGREEDAKQALQMIRHFQFDQVCEIGEGTGAFRFLVKGH